MNERSLSALPSRTARVVAFSSVLVAGLAGGTIGYALVDVQGTGECAVPTGIGMVVGSVGFALGMSIVAVLGLRAVGEWRERNSPDDTDPTR